MRDINTKKIKEISLKAIEKCMLGTNVIETVSEYALDDEKNEMKLVKQKISEKTIPPNTDIIKLVFQSCEEEKKDYENLTDEELEKEKQRLIKQLKEKESAG